MAPGGRRTRSSARRLDPDDTSRPVLITEARRSYEEELAYRKKRYFLLMSVRIPALVLAGIAFMLWHNGWIALAIVAGSIPIPWIAVVGANDRLARGKGEVRGYAGGGEFTVQGPLALPPSMTGGTRGGRASGPTGDAP